MRNLKTILAADDALDRRLNQELSAEYTAGVDSALHRRIMNRVSRSSEPVGRPATSLTLAAGTFAILVAVAGVMMFQATPGPTITVPAAGTANLGVPATLKQHIAQLEIAQALPEAALREEYERLKSDLRKMGIES